MSQYLGSERARIEQAQRREAFRRNSQLNSFREMVGFTNRNNKGYSEFRMRRLAPFAITTHFFAILFLFHGLFQIQNRWWIDLRLEWKPVT